MHLFDTRELWLNAAAEKMRVWIAGAPGNESYEAPLISVGFPRGSRGRSTSNAIGQCWDKSTSGDNERAHIFIIPTITDPEEVLAILLHELVHASVGTKCGHRGAFRSVALGVGLTGKMTATVAGEELKPRLTKIIEQLGKYPHPGMKLPPKGSKGSRLLKVQCGGCGCIIRITRKWLDWVGPPTCGCGTAMQEGD